MRVFDLEIYKLADKLAIEIDGMTMKLPRFEFFEEGRQIRRSSKSVVANIVEGYGRRNYNKGFVRFLIHALASNDETQSHLRLLFGTGRIDLDVYFLLIEKSEKLGRKLYCFLQAVKVSG